MFNIAQLPVTHSPILIISLQQSSSPLFNKCAPIEHPLPARQKFVRHFGASAPRSVDEGRQVAHKSVREEKESEGTKARTGSSVFRWSRRGRSPDVVRYPRVAVVGFPLANGGRRPKVGSSDSPLRGAISPRRRAREGVPSPGRRSPQIRPPRTSFVPVSPGEGKEMEGEPAEDAPACGAEPSRAGLEPTVPDERLITTRVGGTSKGSPTGEQSQQGIPHSPPAEADRRADQINYAFNSASPQLTLEKVLTAATDADMEDVLHQVNLHQQTLTLARSEVQEIDKEVEENEKQLGAMAEAEDWAGAEALGERVAELKLRPAASAGGADAETKPAEEETKPAEEIDAAALGAVGQVVTASCSGGGSGRSSCGGPGVNDLAVRTRLPSSIERDLPKRLPSNRAERPYWTPTEQVRPRWLLASRAKRQRRGTCGGAAGRCSYMVSGTEI